MRLYIGGRFISWLQRNEEFTVLKKCLLYLEQFLRPTASFPVLAVYLRQDGRLFPGPGLFVVPIDIVFYLFYRQSHYPGQLCRPHRSVQPPHHWPVLGFAEPTLRSLIVYPAILHTNTNYKTKAFNGMKGRDFPRFLQIFRQKNTCRNVRK